MTTAGKGVRSYEVGSLAARPSCARIGGGAHKSVFIRYLALQSCLGKLSENMPLKNSFDSGKEKLPKLS